MKCNGWLFFKTPVSTNINGKKKVTIKRSILSHNQYNIPEGVSNKGAPFKSMTDEAKLVAVSEYSERGTALAAPSRKMGQIAGMGGGGFLPLRKCVPCHPFLG